MILKLPIHCYLSIFFNFTVCHVIADELQWEISQVDPRKMLEVIKTLVLIEK